MYKATEREREISKMFCFVFTNQILVDVKYCKNTKDNVQSERKRGRYQRCRLERKREREREIQ